jgi:hypothetical protein
MPRLGNGGGIQANFSVSPDTLQTIVTATGQTLGDILSQVGQQTGQTIVASQQTQGPGIGTFLLIGAAVYLAFKLGRR